jgi:adenosine deaminase
MPRSPVANSELHLHLEGSLSAETAVAMAWLRGHPWGLLTPAQLRRKFRFRDFGGFLQVIREMCAILASYDALERAARELSIRLRSQGVSRAEVYCSPYIFVRWGMDFGETLGALDRGFEEGERGGGATCAILLDTVRQWGPQAASIVLDGFAEHPMARVVGFGMGGEEGFPMEVFETTYARARDLGLRTTVHAGEIAGPADVWKAVEVLKVDRIAHGVKAVEDHNLLERIRQSGVTLDLAITSNYMTGAVRGPHPIRRFLDQGITLTLGTDDPSLFRTSLPMEFARARRFCGVSEEELRQLARNAVTSSFADDAEKSRLLEELERRRVKGEG